MSEYDLSAYPQLREVLDERFAILTDDQLESAFASTFGEGITPAEYEDFFGGLAKSIGGFAQKAAPVLATAAQGALKGGAAGSVAGPWGALGGAVLGGVGSALQQHTTGPARDVGTGLTGVVNVAGALTGGGGGTAAPPARPTGIATPSVPGAPAAATLTSLLARPEFAQALGVLLRARNAPVPVGGAAVPASAFAGLLGSLAREAEAESAGYGDAYVSWLPDAEPIDPGERSIRLLELLGDTDAEAWDGDLDADAFDDEFDESFDEDAFVDDYYPDLGDDLVDVDVDVDVDVEVDFEFEEAA